MCFRLQKTGCLRNVGIFIVEGRLPELTENQALLQVFILDSLARYEAENTKDAESVIERVLPRLQHANCAVVLSAVKVKHHSKPKQGYHKSVLTSSSEPTLFHGFPIASSKYYVRWHKI